MQAAYEKDIIAWAQEQARLLRTGHLTELDIENIAEEIEDVGKSEQREVANRMSVLLAHLLKWKCQPERRGSSWQNTIRAQRKGIEKRVKRTPSLKSSIADADWLDESWQDAIVLAGQETGLDFPAASLWTVEQVLDQDFFPE